MKLAAGALSIEDLSKYPVAAAMIQPVRRPRTTDVLFMIGDPKRSQMMIVTKTENPSPMNSALPQGRGCGAVMEGQSWKGPLSGRLEQFPLPPAQLDIADWTSFMPISATVLPVTIGGNSFFRSLGDMNERPISRRAHRQAVPSMAP